MSNNSLEVISQNRISLLIVLSGKWCDEKVLSKMIEGVYLKGFFQRSFVRWGYAEESLKKGHWKEGRYITRKK